MEESRRDELLVRLDENVKDIKTELAVQGKHLAQINGRLNKHDENITGIETTVYGRHTDRGLCGDVSTLRRLVYSIIGLAIAGGAVGGLEAGDIIHLFGG